ncbi:MAG: PD40 domain-containing protein [Bacteroidetes bacterium]|nr:PD40 domain-containing protein [Bacteroidota bacterium]
MVYRLTWVCLVFLFFNELKAQNATETFGSNRIQFKEFDWKYLSSENFDIYFYGARKKVAQEALQYLEAEFDRITDLLGYYPYQKTKVFLYNSITDLQQSNVGLNHTRYQVSGETEFIKPYVEIAHPGNLEEFKQELVFKMSNLLVNEMMFGGSLRDMFTSTVLLNLPEWFIDGTSNYVAHGWNSEMDDYVRQLVVSKKANKALRLPSPDAALVGQSIWNYIVEKYGKSSINNILNYTRIIRNEERSVLITLGVPFKQLMNDWKEYYLSQEKKVSEAYISVSDSNQFTKHKHHQAAYTTVKISPDGKTIAYAENDRGIFTVKVKSLENNHETIILRGGNKVIKQTVDYRVPLLSWADATTLGVIGVRNGQYIFWLYDLKSRSKLPRELDKFSNIRSFSFSNNGRLVIVSADFEGQNDLFLLSSRRDRTKRLTNDAFDDLDPAFIPNSNTVVFSSNRFSDSLTTDVKAFQKLSPYYNLFLYNIDTTTNRLKRVTHTLSKDLHPRAMDDHNFFYLSDQRGITNIFRYNTLSGSYAQVTNFNSSIKDYDIHFDTRKLALVLTQNLRENIFIEDNFDPNRQIFTAPTRRKEIQQVRAMIERKKKEQPAKPTSIKDLINARIKERQDSLVKEKPQPLESKKDTTVAIKKNNEISTDNYSFDEQAVTPAAPANENVLPSSEKPATNQPAKKTLNTDDYVFEDEAVKQSNKPNEVFLTRYTKARETSKVQGPFSYLPKFSYDNLVTNFVIDKLRGTSMRIETQMNDMLENYRFNLGLQVALSDLFSSAYLRGGDAYGEFQYLRHRVDFSARVDRKVIYWQTKANDLQGSGTISENQKYSWQRVEVGAAYPISVRTRVSLKPFMGYTEYVDRGIASSSSVALGTLAFNPSKTQFYTGARVDLVYDNSVTTGLNIIEGTRGKFSAVSYRALGNSKKNFSQVFADLRHYQKIYKEIVFAVRGYAGTFLGRSPKKYMLGGIDNWAFNNINYTGKQNPLVNASNTYNENILFSEFATCLRGFDYATQYGNSVAVANIEFRVPLVRALSSGPITSNFFRNLQFTGFYDIGSSWTGAIPIGAANEGPQREIKSSGFTIDIKEYLNPWLYSYGVGFRSMMFGYYVKVDMAWPVINYQVQSPRVQASLGFDF